MRYRSYDNGGNYFWLGLLIFLMFGGFKTLFLLLPLFFSLLPLIIFLFVGYKLIKLIFSNKTIHSHIKNNTKQRSHFVELMIHLTTHAIKADGVVDTREIQAIITFFQTRLGFNQNKLLWINDLIRHALHKHFPLQKITQEMNAQFKSYEKQLCIELIMAIIIADGKVTKEEISLLDEIADQLSIERTFFDQLKQRYLSTNTSENYKSDYDILGVSKSDSPEAIKKAYKQLCKKYHPDKVQHLGEEFKKFAEQKIKEINSAYDNINQKTNV